MHDSDLNALFAWHILPMLLFFFVIQIFVDLGMTLEAGMVLSLLVTTTIVIVIHWLASRLQ